MPQSLSEAMTMDDEDARIPDRRRLFDLPPRIPAAGAAAVRAKDIIEWLGALPLANAEGAAFSLLEKLEYLKTVEIPASERGRILDVLEPTLRSLIGDLGRFYERQTLPLQPRHQRLALLAQELLASVVCAYKIILQQLESEGLAKRLWHRGAAAAAVYGALRALGAIHLIDYKLYRATMPGVWREANGLFHLSVRNGFSQRKLVDDSQQPAVQRTVEDQYKRQVLLALAHPYRLGIGQVERVYRWIPAWVHLVKMEPYKKEQGAASGVLAAGSGDRAPLVIRSGGETVDGWILDLRPLAGALRKELKSRRGASEHRVGVDRSLLSGDSLPEDTLEKVMLSWEMETHRRGSRVDSRGRLSAVSGLGPIHRLLAGHPAGSAASRLGSLGLGAEKDGVPAPGQSWVEEGGWPGRTEVEAIDLESNQGVTWAGGFGNGAAQQVIDCEIRDVSAGGYQLSVDRNDAKGIQVGALLALKSEQEQSSPEIWRLGVVRWLKVGRDGGSVFGVQLLDGSPRPVTVERDRNESSVVDRWAGLLLRSAGEQPDSLFTPAFFATRDDSFAVVYKGRHVAVTLRQMVESTPAFNQYLFRAGAKRS